MLWPFNLRSGRLPGGVTWREAPWVNAPLELALCHGRSIERFKRLTFDAEVTRRGRVAILAEWFQYNDFGSWKAPVPR